MRIIMTVCNGPKGRSTGFYDSARRDADMSFLVQEEEPSHHFQPLYGPNCQDHDGQGDVIFLRDRHKSICQTDASHLRCKISINLLTRQIYCRNFSKEI